MTHFSLQLASVAWLVLVQVLSSLVLVFVLLLEAVLVMVNLSASAKLPLLALGAIPSFACCVKN